MLLMKLLLDVMRSVFIDIDMYLSMCMMHVFEPVHCYYPTANSVRNGTVMCTCLSICGMSLLHAFVLLRNYLFTPVVTKDNLR